MKYNNVLRSKYEVQYVQVLSKEANVISCITVNKCYDNSFYFFPKNIVFPTSNFIATDKKLNRSFSAPRLKMLRGDKSGKWSPVLHTARFDLPA